MDKLRPVEVRAKGEVLKGYFHRFTHSSYGYYSETRVLVELEDGRLRFYDPYFVKFMDRKNSYGEANKN